MSKSLPCQFFLSTKPELSSTLKHHLSLKAIINTSNYNFDDDDDDDNDDDNDDDDDDLWIEIIVN